MSQPIEAASPRNSVAATPKSSKGEEKHVATPCEEEEEEGEKSRPPSSPAPETGLPRPHIPSAGAILAQVSKIDVGVQTEQVSTKRRLLCVAAYCQCNLIQITQV